MSPRSGPIERLRLTLDRWRRVQMNQLAELAIDGDVEYAIEGLERIEADAWSRAVRGWANAGLGFVLLAAGRWTEAESVAARRPEPESQVLLGLAVGAARDRLDPGFAAALAECRSAIDAMGTARVLTDHGQVDEVIQQSLELPRGPGSRALLALELGLHALREHETAIRVGELVWEREHWEIVAYWIAVSCAVIEDAAAAVTWLDRAAERGFSALPTIDRELRFDPFRQMPDFIKARAHIAANPRRTRHVAEGGLPWGGPGSL